MTQESIIAKASPVNLQQQAVFGSQGTFLLTLGVYERFQLYVNEAELGLGSMSRALSKKLANAKRSGVKNPIVVGAFPFDFKQPAQLFIPNSYQRMETAQMAEKLSCGGQKTNPSTLLIDKPDAKGYMHAVESAKQLFEKTELEKIVLSKSIDLHFDKTVDSTSILYKLLQKNSSGYHFSYPLSSGKVFMGVSPELLLRKQSEFIESNPLAGSRKRDADHAIDVERRHSLQRSEKDLQEHRYVTDAIYKKLSPLCQSLFVPDRPSLLSTQTMWHLSSHIDGVVKGNEIGAVELACALHPTPAVGGVPTDMAKKFIVELEDFEREFFAGTLGWMDEHGNGEWVVSIRCASVDNYSARLYAGAGIVAASSPQEELAEVQAKLKTMTEVFGFAATQTEKTESGEARVC